MNSTTVHPHRGGRRLAGALAVPTVLLVTLGTAPAGAATLVPGANWQMNERTGPMRDSSGNANNSSHIQAGISRTGATYHFTGLGSVIVPSSASLQPGDRSFTVSIRLHLDQVGNPQAPLDQNFIQKGGLSDALGQWKIETSGPHLHCRVAGTAGVASIWFFGGAPALKTGFHTLTCTKLADRVTFTVDGVTKTQLIATGTVSTPRNVTIGGKGPHCGTNCDDMKGDVDWATIGYL